MIKFLFIRIFLIPFIMDWWLLVFFISLISLFLIFGKSYNYFINLGYGMGLDIISGWLVILTV